MGDHYNNSGSFGEVPPLFSMPPPNFQNQSNFNSNYKGGNPNPSWTNSAPNLDNYPVNSGYGGNFQSQGDFRNDNFGKSRDNAFQNNRGTNKESDFNRGNNFGNERRGGDFGNGGGNKGGFNKGGGSGSGGDMITQEDTIFVCGMDPSTTEADIQSHFGAIGVIKKDKKTMKPKIWVYKHKDTGVSKGEATVTYDDVIAAQSAISWFDGRDFNGSTVRVSLAQRQNNWNKSGGSSRGGGFSSSRGTSSGGGSSGGGSDRGGFRGYDRGRDGDSSGNREDRSNARGNSSGSTGGSSGGRTNNVPQRDGDWVCSECSNTNFAWRNECNRCKAPKRDGGGGGGGSGGGGSAPNAASRGSSNSGNFNENRRMFSHGGGRGGNSGNSYGNRDGGDNGGNRSYGNAGGRSNNQGYVGNNGRRDGGPMRNSNDRGRSRPY